MPSSPPILSFHNLPCAKSKRATMQIVCDNLSTDIFIPGWPGPHMNERVATETAKDCTRTQTGLQDRAQILNERRVSEHEYLAHDIALTTSSGSGSNQKVNQFNNFRGLESNTREAASSCSATLNANKQVEVEPVVRKSFKLLGEQRTIGWYESIDVTSLERPHEALLMSHKLRDGDLYIHKVLAQRQDPQTWVWDDKLADWQVIHIGERWVVGGAKRELVIQPNGRPYWKKISV